ncbi:MAG: alpha/beta hydrolase fold protein [Chloroflexi bacterium]|nr:alpha/beta hydrolase fold protein [Chloroflexota bacterium]
MVAHIKGPLYWEQLGKAGHPIAFVHPNPMDHSCWVYQMDHFSTWYRCVGIDLPGYGKSPVAEQGLTIADMAEACWGAMDEVTREPAIIVGLSVGWHIVMHMVHQQPERTLAILMTGCSYSGAAPKLYTGHAIAAFGDEGMAARHGRIFNDWSASFRDTDYGRYFAGTLVERNRWADAASIVHIFQALAPPDPEEIFDGVKAPSLIITGSEDSSHRGAFALQERIAGCELVTMEAAGHACNMERPWEWDQHALRFLTKHGLFDGDPPAAAPA